MCCRSLSYALSKWEQHAMQTPIRKRYLEVNLHACISRWVAPPPDQGLTFQSASWALKAGLHEQRKHKHKPRVTRDDASTSTRKTGTRACACACVVLVSLQPF